MSIRIDDGVPVLVCLVAALVQEEVARDMDAAFTSSDESVRAEARFVDRFIAEAIEAGLLDAHQTWNSADWEEAVTEVHGEEE